MDSLTCGATRSMAGGYGLQPPLTGGPFADAAIALRQISTVPQLTDGRGFGGPLGERAGRLPPGPKAGMPFRSGFGLSRGSGERLHSNARPGPNSIPVFVRTSNWNRAKPFVDVDVAFCRSGGHGAAFTGGHDRSQFDPNYAQPRLANESQQALGGGHPQSSCDLSKNCWDAKRNGHKRPLLTYGQQAFRLCRWQRAVAKQNGLPKKDLSKGWAEGFLTCRETYRLCEGR
jgi:hypothetical protein